MPVKRATKSTRRTSKRAPARKTNSRLAKRPTTAKRAGKRASSRTTAKRTTNTRKSAKSSAKRAPARKKATSRPRAAKTGANRAVRANGNGAFVERVPGLKSGLTFTASRTNDVSRQLASAGNTFARLLGEATKVLLLMHESTEMDFNVAPGTKIVLRRPLVVVNY